MELSRMEWWEWDIPQDATKAGIVEQVFFHQGIDASANDSSELFAERIHPDDLMVVKAAFENHLYGKAEYFDTEYRVYDRFGKLKWLHDRGMVLTRTSDGRPLKMIGLVQDITHRMHTQSELLNDKHNAEEADRLKTAFLTNMSHEVRTPMNAIIGFSELLSDPNISREDIANYTKIIKNRSSHLLQIVNDILDISRIEANQVELKETQVILNNMMDELYLCYAQRLIDEKKYKVILNFVKSLDDDSSALTIDELRLRQIIGNLLDNAIKFTREGSVEFGYRLNDGMVVFFVSDTGIGIPIEKHEVIFERFRQVDTSLARQYGGNGLGLAICKAFVEIMGGKIWMESTPGSGSTFFFSIPVIQKDIVRPAVKSEYSGLTDFNWQGKRILLVEDDFHSTVFMRELFNLTGIELLCAGTGQEAIELFNNGSNIDLVLMDIQLPDISGIELTRLLKEINPKVPVFAQTAYAMAGDNLKCIQAGCDDYISKPLNISEMFGKINKVLGR